LCYYLKERKRQREREKEREIEIEREKVRKRTNQQARKQKRKRKRKRKKDSFIINEISEPLNPMAPVSILSIGSHIRALMVHIERKRGRTACARIAPSLP